MQSFYRKIYWQRVKCWKCWNRIQYFDFLFNFDKISIEYSKTISQKRKPKGNRTNLYKVIGKKEREKDIKKKIKEAKYIQDISDFEQIKWHLRKCLIFKKLKILKTYKNAKNVKFERILVAKVVKDFQDFNWDTKNR